MIGKIANKVKNNRKFYFSMVCLIFIFLGYALSAAYSGFKDIFPTYCLTITSILATFCGSNVMASRVNFSNTPDSQPVSPTAITPRTPPIEVIPED